MENNELPEQVNTGGYLPPPEKKPNWLMMGGAVIILAAVVCYIMNGFVFKFVSMSDFDTNVKNMVSDISTLKSSVTTISVIQQQGDTNKANISSMETRIKTLESKPATPVDLSLYAKLSELEKLRNDMNSNLGNNATITTLQNQVKVLSDAKVVSDKRLPI